MGEEPTLLERRREVHTITPRMDLLKDHAFFAELIPKIKLEIEDHIPGAGELQQGHDRLFKVLQGAALPGIESKKESVPIDGPSNEDALAELTLQKARVQEAADQLWAFKTGDSSRKEAADYKDEPIGHLISNLHGYSDHLERIEQALMDSKD